MTASGLKLILHGIALTATVHHTFEVFTGQLCGQKSTSLAILFAAPWGSPTSNLTWPPSIASFLQGSQCVLCPSQLDWARAELLRDSRNNWAGWVCWVGCPNCPCHQTGPAGTTRPRWTEWPSPIPIPPQNWGSVCNLGRRKAVHKLDLGHAYQEVPLDDASKQFVVINTHKGLFQYNRLPFGVASATTIFQKAMQSILQGIEHIKVNGQTESEHWPA